VCVCVWKTRVFTRSNLFVATKTRIKKTVKSKISPSVRLARGVTVSPSSVAELSAEVFEQSFRSAFLVDCRPLRFLLEASCTPTPSLLIRTRLFFASRHTSARKKVKGEGVTLI